MVQFQLYDTFTISLEGVGPVYDRLYATFRSFESDTESIPDISIICDSNVRNPEIDSILGSPEKFYAETANQFLSVRYGETVSISPDRSKIWCSPGAPPDFVRLLAEWMLRRKLLDQRFAMIHASGVKYEGQTIVFPAWRHTGKTNTMLTLLEEGASYISDDRLFVSDDGRIRGYPTDLHLMSYNYRSFPEIAPNTFSSKVRSFISEKVNKMTQSHSSKISKGLNLVNEAVVARNDWRDVTNVFPETETIFKDKLDQIVLLRTTSDPTPHIEKLSKEKLSASLSSINHREWDLDLIEISAAYHSLIDDDTLLGEIEDGIEQQREIFADVGSQVDTNVLYVPREEEWQKETKAEILSLVTSND